MDLFDNRTCIVALSGLWNYKSLVFCLCPLKIEYHNYTEDLIFDILLTKKSLMELDSFISPLTVVGKEDKTIIKYKKDLDKVVLPTLKFLENN